MPGHSVFPSERYGLKGEDGHRSGKAMAYAVDSTGLIGPRKASWDAARKQAGVQCRWCDMRHTAISRMAEGHSSGFGPISRAVRAWESTRL